MSTALYSSSDAAEPLVEPGVKPGVNEPLVREVLAFIDLHRERLDMGHFMTKSEDGLASGCFMGWGWVLTRPGFDLDRLDAEVKYGTGNTECFPARGLPEVRELFGLDLHSFHYIYEYTGVSVPGRYGMWEQHRPTFEELCWRVEVATGIRFKPPLEVADDRV